jgi:hypothetical protein
VEDRGALAIEIAMAQQAAPPDCRIIYVLYYNGVVDSGIVETAILSCCCIYLLS